MFVDLYFSGLETVPRADIETELEERMPPDCSVVGAGIGRDLYNIDLEVPDRESLPRIVDILRSLGVRSDTMLALSDTGEHITLGDFPVR